MVARGLLAVTRRRQPDEITNWERGRDIVVVVWSLSAVIFAVGCGGGHGPAPDVAALQTSRIGGCRPGPPIPGSSAERLVYADPTAVPMAEASDLEATTWVSSTGESWGPVSDSGDCASGDAPALTGRQLLVPTQHDHSGAVDAAVPGDVVSVAPGIYTSMCACDRASAWWALVRGKRFWTATARDNLSFTHGRAERRHPGFSRCVAWASPMAAACP